jgi:site-specific DNA-cytosine methylase
MARVITATSRGGGQWRGGTWTPIDSSTIH